MFNEAQKNQMKRMTRDLLTSPQGRDWTRLLYKEINDPKGNYAGVKKEMFDMLSDAMNGLFLANKPVQSK